MVAIRRRSADRQQHRMTDIGQSLKSIGPVPFWKMNGSGNDFVVVDNRNLTLPETLKENGRGASAVPAWRLDPMAWC